MSIYATLWSLRFPRHGDEYPGCGWITVTAQGVPDHVGRYPGEEDPYAEFLPPLPPIPDEESMRAVVFVTEETRKGTPRSGQEYEDPLLVITGEEYEKTSFGTLHRRLCDALRGDRPRVTLLVLRPTGEAYVLREDGTSIPIQDVTETGDEDGPVNDP